MHKELTIYIACFASFTLFVVHLLKYSGKTLLRLPLNQKFIMRLKLNCRKTPLLVLEVHIFSKANIYWKKLVVI